jgi:putative FmdB family regulatory protein
LPLYEYRCSSGHHYERTEGFEAPREHACLECGAPARRLLSVPAVIFKGSGFYSTDNRKNSSRNGSAGEEKTAETATAPANGDKPAGEAKPEKTEATAAE